MIIVFTHVCDTDHMPQLNTTAYLCQNNSGYVHSFGKIVFRHRFLEMGFRDGAHVLQHARVLCVAVCCCVLTNSHRLCLGVLQCVAVCCSVLQCVAVC